MELSAVKMREPAAGGSVDVAAALGAPLVRGLGARCVALRPGPWRPVEDARLRPGGMPLIVVDGAILSSAVLHGRESAELLGAGDPIPVEPVEDGSGFATRLRALTRARLAVLDDRVRSAAATSPALARALFDAASRRTNAAAVQLVAAQLPAIDDRLRILFPSIAERWGIVSAEGVLLPSFLSHSVLAGLVGARRPSLTAAVARLVDADVLERLPDRRWRLAPELAAVG